MIAASRNTVLVVEDHADVRRAFCKRLAHAGFNALPAASGYEALEQARRQTFDAVSLDRRLPDMDGFDLAALLRDNVKTRDVPIVVITGTEVDKNFLHLCKEFDIAFFIKKPCDRNLLVETMLDLCSRQRVA